MLQGDEFAVQGAQLKCNQTQVPVPGTFNCINPVHQIGGRSVGTELDFIPVFNVLPFTSPCKILSAAAAGTPVPCVPFPTPWQGGHPGFLSLGRKLLLTSSHCFCAFGGKIEFSTSGQSVASLGNVAGFAALLPAPPPVGSVFVCAPGDSTRGWNAELNQVPLVPNAKYLVGQHLYETDDQGRVARTRGVLTLNKHERNEDEQTKSVRLKDGRPNPAFVPDPRADHQKKRNLNGVANPNYVKDPRRQLERREYIDDGGHLYGAQFDGAGEQINYVAQDMDQNQPRKQTDNWYELEKRWAEELRKPNPPNVYVEQTVRYPKVSNGAPSSASKRPQELQAKYWINEKYKKESFPQ